jgi:hypothetical protein
VTTQTIDAASEDSFRGRPDEAASAASSRPAARSCLRSVRGDGCGVPKTRFCLQIGMIPWCERSFGTPHGRRRLPPWLRSSRAIADTGSLPRTCA